MFNLEKRVSKLEEQVKPEQLKEQTDYPFSIDDWTKEETHIAADCFVWEKPLPEHLAEKLQLTGIDLEAEGMTPEELHEAAEEIKASRRADRAI